MIIMSTTTLVGSPKPTSDECDILKKHTNYLISHLQSVQNSLEQASASPNEGLREIKAKVDEMLQEAKAVKVHLSKIQSGTQKYNNRY